MEKWWDKKQSQSGSLCMGQLSDINKQCESKGLFLVILLHDLEFTYVYPVMQIIFGNRWRHLLGERDFWEHVGGIDISLAPSSFGQANTRVF